MIRPHVILAGIKCAPFIIHAYFSWMIKYSKRPDQAPIEVRYKLARKLIVRAINSLKPDIKINRPEYLNEHEGNFLGLSNHRNFIDPLFYIYFSEKPVSFVAKKEAFKYPFVGRLMRCIDAFAIDRADVMQQVRLFKNVSERLKKGDLSYIIFPEGTRMKIKDQIHTLPYRDGSIKPAFWAQKDIIFMAHMGTNYLFGKTPHGFKKRNITFEINKPLKYEEFKDMKTTELMPIIEQKTNETLVRLNQENLQRNLKF